MADKSASSDENSESLPQVTESLENASKSSDAPEDNEPSVSSGILLPQVTESLENASKSSDAPEDNEPSVSRGILKKPKITKPPMIKDRDSNDKIPKVFEIPDMLKEPAKAESLDDDPFMIASLKSSPEAQPWVQTSKEKTDLVPSMKEDTEPAPKKEKSSDESNPPIKIETSEEDREEQLESHESSSEEEPAPRRTSFAERFKKKRSSVIQFFTGQSSRKKKPSKAKPRRSSFIMRKFIALEKELTIDSINKRVTNIFHPEPFEDRDKDGEKEKDEEEETPKRVYLTSAMACMFIISAMSGSAMTELPFCLKESNWFGVFFNLLLGLNGVFAGLCTGWSWTIMEEAWPEYLEYSRIPYQDIAFRAAGVWIRYIVAICLDVSILGSCASYIITIASCIEDIMHDFQFCYTMIIVTVVLTPITMFNSYRNIKIIGVMDVLFSFLFTLMMIISFFLDKPHQGIVTYTHPTFKSVSMSFAGFSYAYGLGAILPSIMVDMADRNMFSQTVVTAYMASMVMYLLLPIIGYAAYGDRTPKHITHSILNSSLHNYAIAVHAIHILQLATTFNVAIIPTLHAFEVRVNCPDRFGLGRFLVRFIIMLVILLVILGIPYLPKFMALIGATTMNLLTFIFPPLFYVCLIYRTRGTAKVKKRTISKREWFIVAEIIILGIIVGILATVMSVEDIDDKERDSCYVNINSFPTGKEWIIQGNRSKDLDK